MYGDNLGGMVSLGGDVCGFEALQTFYGEEPASEKSLGTVVDTTARYNEAGIARSATHLLFNPINSGSADFQVPSLFRVPLMKEVLCVWFTKVVKEPSSPLVSWALCLMPLVRSHQASWCSWFARVRPLEVSLPGLQAGSGLWPVYICLLKPGWAAYSNSTTWTSTDTGTMVKTPRGFGAGSKHYRYTALRKNGGLRVHI
jgi:hypothetical protein